MHLDVSIGRVHIYDSTGDWGYSRSRRINVWVGTRRLCRFSVPCPLVRRGLKKRSKAIATMFEQRRADRLTSQW